MITLSKFKSSTIEQGKRILKVLQFGAKTAKECSPFGYDGNPLAEMTAIYSETSNKAESVIIGYIHKSQLAGVGESRVYALGASGSVVSYVWMKNDGSLELNGSNYTAVRYAPLNAGLQNESSLINIELNKIAAAISSIGGAYIVTPVTVNISGSESVTVKIK